MIRSLSCDALAQARSFLFVPGNRPERFDKARRVVAADASAGGAAVQVDGRMVDLPVVLHAQRLLARAADRR